MRTLIAFLLLTATVSAEWTTAKPSTPFVTAKPACPCGISGCDCPAGECDCGKPHITATVADRGCPPCVRWENEVVPELEAKDWRVRIVRVPFGSEATPSFTFQGRKLEGYGGKAAFFEWLRGTPLPGAKPAGVALASQGAPVGFTQPAPVEFKTVVRSDMHTHTCRYCRTSWSHSDSMNGNRAAHTCPGCGRLEWSQSSGVARVRVPLRNQVQYAYRQPVMRSGCPGGRCP